MPRTEIDVPGLTGIGDAVGRVAAAMRATSVEIEGWAGQGQYAVEGSYVCSADMIRAAEKWGREIAEMAADVRQYGDDLKQTAADYASYDRLSAQQLRQVGDPTFGKASYR